MLRNVLNDYLSSIRDERDFDFPLASLLSAMGFYDIHFTHGRTEIGKDFIAKKQQNGIEYQYALQSKKGDINQAEFRNNVMGQLREASVLGLSHPQFDRNLPRRVVLVTSGRLIGNAPLTFQDFNVELETKWNADKVITWEKDQLIDFFEQNGFTSIHQFTSAGVGGYAQFLLTYSKALEGAISDREIETFSRLWLDESLDYRQRVLRASIEAEIIASKLIGNGKLYEAITVYLALSRVVLQAMFESPDEYLSEIYEQIIRENLLSLCEEFFGELKTSWESQSKQLLPLTGERFGFPMVHYLVWLARILEVLPLYFFLSNDRSKQEEIVSLFTDFIETEPGSGHVPGDRYATSVVWATLAMLSVGEVGRAKAFVKKCVVWLCDRVEKQFGLADFDADEYIETATLLGFPFEAIKVDHNRSSFLASILADLAAFIGDADLYADVVNDFEACEIVYNYWQIPNTPTVLTINGPGLITYPNVSHQFALTRFEDFVYAEHIKHEPNSFEVALKAGLNSLILLSVLLKDRYFPKMWKQIVEQAVRTGSTGDDVSTAAAA